MSEKRPPKPVVRKLKDRVGGRLVEASDLYDIARLILWELMDSRGWSINELARQVGVPFGKLYPYLDAKRPRNQGESKPSGGMDLGTLSQICLHLNDTPVEFFSRYAPGQRKEDAERERSYARFRTLIRDLDDANDLADCIEEMNKAPGTFQSNLQAWADSFRVVRRQDRGQKVFPIRR